MIIFELSIEILQNGNMDIETLGNIIKNQRKSLDLTQKELSLACDVGARFISDLENGKETCEIGKSLRIMKSLGLKLEIHDHFDQRISS